MRILLVEDEKKVATFLQKGFQAEAYTVDVADDGTKGAALAMTDSYDAVILDVMLPGKDGFAILREMRNSGITTPVLMLSAKSELESRVEGLNLGADDYLPKPFAFSEVLARLRAIIRRRSPDIQGSVLAVGDLRMDVLTRRVHRGERDIILTNKEFELLEYLLRNRNRVLSRVILTEHIWDMHFDSDTNIVDVVVNRLRRKIDDGAPTKLIHTVRGVGYVVKDEADETPANR
jgi:heavy metal response regulator